jgi:hypothetical protein
MMPGRADPVLVRRVLEETGVDQTVATLGWSGYAEALAEAAFAWLRARIPAAEALSSLARGLAPFVALVAGLAALVLLYLLVRSVLRRRRGHAPASAAAKPRPAIVPEVQRGRAGWRMEMDRRLAAGDVTGALEALWWWFAHSLCPAAVDRSWTSQDLLAHCGRPDLAPPARALDRLIYGSDRPDADEVRRFLGRLETLLP